MDRVLERVPVWRRSFRKRLNLVRRLTSARYAFLDPLHDPSRAVVILGSARSGTTWLAALLSAAPNTRFILEPMHTLRSPLVPPGFKWGEWRARDDADPVLLQAWENVLAGRARSKWSDSRNSCRFATRRVIKDIAATNLLHWVHSHFPTVPIVYLVRHPFATASSVARAASSRSPTVWGALTGSVIEDLVCSPLLDGPLQPFRAATVEIEGCTKHPFSRNVLRWCMENYLALTGSPESGLLLLRYEDLLAGPEDQLAKIAALTDLDMQPALEMLDRPSSTDWHWAGSPASRVERANAWTQSIRSDELAEGLEILQVFGLRSHFFA